MPLGWSQVTTLTDTKHSGYSLLLNKKSMSNYLFLSLHSCHTKVVENWRAVSAAATHLRMYQLKSKINVCF